MRLLATIFAALILTGPAAAQERQNPDLAQLNADAERMLAEVADPRCDPARLVCAYGRAALYEEAQANQLLAKVYASSNACKNHTDSKQCALEGFAAAVTSERSLSGGGERFRAQAGFSWPQPVEYEAFRVFADRVFSELQTDACPLSDRLCLTGELSVLDSLFEARWKAVCATKPPDRAPCVKRWEALNASVDAKLEKQWLAILRTAGWPSKDTSIAARVAAGSLSRRLDSEPALEASITAIEAARAAGKTDDTVGMLADRLAIKRGQAQPYGFLGRCQGAAWVPHPILEPDAIEARRAQAGEDTFREWAARQNRLCARVAEKQASASPNEASPS